MPSEINCTCNFLKRCYLNPNYVLHFQVKEMALIINNNISRYKPILLVFCKLLAVCSFSFIYTISCCWSNSYRENGLIMPDWIWFKGGKQSISFLILETHKGPLKTIMSFENQILKRRFSHSMQYIIQFRHSDSIQYMIHSRYNSAKINTQGLELILHS